MNEPMNWPIGIFPFNWHKPHSLFLKTIPSISLFQQIFIKWRLLLLLLLVEKKIFGEGGLNYIRSSSFI